MRDFELRNCDLAFLDVAAADWFPTGRREAGALEAAAAIVVAAVTEDALEDLPRGGGIGSIVEMWNGSDRSS